MYHRLFCKHLAQSSDTKEIANQTERIVPGDSNGSLLYERLGEFCQVSSDDDELQEDPSKRLDAQVETIFSWLRVTPESHCSELVSEPSQPAEVQDGASNYENCIELQRGLCSNAASDSLLKSNDAMSLNDLSAPVNGPNDGQSPKLCKEVLLKVVVDQNNELNNCTEVFYIDPVVSSHLILSFLVCIRPSCFS